MRIITDLEATQTLMEMVWLDAQGQIKPPEGVLAYRTVFEQTGVVAANMANLFLCDFTDERVESGILRIFQIFPADDPPIRVFQHLLSLYGLHDVRDSAYSFLFQEEYEPLLALMSWCMACGWGIHFVSSHPSIAMQTGEDDGFTVYLPKTQQLKPTVEDLLKNLDFELLRT